MGDMKRDVFRLPGRTNSNFQSGHLVPSSVALVPSSFLLLLVRHLFLVAWHLFLVSQVS